MTTAAESHDAQLAAIKAKHQAIRDQFGDPSMTRVDLLDGAATAEQMGLRGVMVDPLGRFWKLERGYADMVFDPCSLARPGGPNAPDPDDTQAAQGFKAHE